MDLEIDRTSDRSWALIDREYIGRIIRATASDPELFDEVIHQFHQSTLERLASIRQRPSLENACFQVHALKGAAGTLGAEGLRRAAEAVEREIEGGNFVVRHLDDIERELKSGLEELRRENKELRLSDAEISGQMRPLVGPTGD